jgi:hypothetical protein
MIIDVILVVLDGCNEFDAAGEYTVLSILVVLDSLMPHLFGWLY